MWSYNNTTELYHYGVPGMKWGHKKAAIVSTEKHKSPQQKLEEYAKGREPKAIKVLKKAGEIGRIDENPNINKKTKNKTKSTKDKKPFEMTLKQQAAYSAAAMVAVPLLMAGIGHMMGRVDRKLVQTGYDYLSLKREFGL